MEDTDGVSAPLVLLVDEDPITGNLLRPLLRPHGLEVVQARASIAALELLQRVAQRFRLAVVSLEMSGLSGVVVLETVRLFRPGLATICLAAAAGAREECVAKPAGADQLRARIAEALAGAPSSMHACTLAPEAIRKARAAFEHSGSLVDAAREVGLSLSDQSALDT
jgi:CheY-like chemotaxis protein